MKLRLNKDPKLSCAGSELFTETTYCSMTSFSISFCCAFAL